MINVRLGRKSRLAGAAVVAVLATLGLATLCILFTPAANWLSYPLRVESNPTTAEMIVVLGGGIGHDGTLSDGSLRRVWYGVRLYKEGCAPFLAFATGKTDGEFSEARAMGQAAMMMGIPPQAIVLEERSTRTHENAVEIKRILKARSATSILLVTHSTHMARAMASFRKVGVSAIPAPTDLDEMDAHRPVTRVLLFEKVAYEYLAWILYWWRGWV
jgi:uncharacterized SAM-binding protein YcdF (DUF218 family)